MTFFPSGEKGLYLLALRWMLMSPGVLFWLTSNRKLIFNYKKENIVRELKMFSDFLDLRMT